MLSDKSHLTPQQYLNDNTSQVDSNSCLVWSQSGKQLITVVGVEDIVVVATNDAVMVVHKEIRTS